MFGTGICFTKNDNPELASEQLHSLTVPARKCNGNHRLEEVKVQVCNSRKKPFSNVVQLSLKIMSAMMPELQWEQKQTPKEE